MDLDELVKELVKHNEDNPKHRLPNCSCLDEYALKLHGFANRQDEKVKNQLLTILRRTITWEKMRDDG